MCLRINVQSRLATQSHSSTKQPLEERDLRRERSRIQNRSSDRRAMRRSGRSRSRVIANLNNSLIREHKRAKTTTVYRDSFLNEHASINFISTLFFLSLSLPCSRSDRSIRCAFTAQHVKLETNISYRVTYRVACATNAQPRVVPATNGERKKQSLYREISLLASIITSSVQLRLI